MTHSRDDGQRPDKKPWITPEVREQSVLSLTQGKTINNSSEASPGTGPS